MASKQTDNSYLEEKVELRLQTVHLLEKQKIRVLECFAGDGVIWREVKLRTKKEIDVLRIDQKANKKGVYLKGNNLKYIKPMDLSSFDIVDLDAYGIPIAQLELVFEKQFTGFVHVTLIQSGMGQLPYKLFDSLGISSRMYRKAPLLFSKNGMRKAEQYLALRGVKKITGFFLGNKNYFWFFNEKKC